MKSDKIPRTRGSSPFSHKSSKVLARSGQLEDSMRRAHTKLTFVSTRRAPVHEVPVSIYSTAKAVVPARSCEQTITERMTVVPLPRGQRQCNQELKHEVSYSVEAAVTSATKQNVKKIGNNVHSQPSL